MKVKSTNLEGKYIPNTEKVVVRLFQSVFAGQNIRICTIIPPSTTYPVIKVNRIGGKLHNIVIDRSMITIQVYAETPEKAMDLANQCRLVLLQCKGEYIDESWSAWWQETSSVIWFPDPDTQIPRYQLTGEIDLKCKT